MATRLAALRAVEGFVGKLRVAHASFALASQVCTLPQTSIQTSDTQGVQPMDSDHTQMDLVHFQRQHHSFY